MCIKYIFFRFYRSVRFEENINILRIDGMRLSLSLNLVPRAFPHPPSSKGKALGTRLCCPVEWVSECNNRKRTTYELCRFWSIPIFPDLSFCLFRNIVGCLTTGGPNVRWEEIIKKCKWDYVDYERCCVTKMRFTRVCMGTSRICFKYLKLNVLWIKRT